MANLKDQDRKQKTDGRVRFDGMISGSRRCSFLARTRRSDDSRMKKGVET